MHKIARSIRIATALVALSVTPTVADTVAPLLADGGFEGRLKLAAQLDEPDIGYCLDVPGPPENIRLDLNAWVHSCHPAALPDQIYQYDAGGLGQFRFVFDPYDSCLTVTEAKADTPVRYEPCTDDPRQSFDVTPSGTIKLRGTDLCLVAENMQRGGPADAIGVGRDVGANDFVRALDLQPCGTRPSELETWTVIE